MLRVIAEAEGFHFYETLTGFKWIGNKAMELQSQGATVFLGYEEAIGFCVGAVVPDKDGVSAAPVFAEMAVNLSSRGLTVKSHLDAIYRKYGELVSINHYYFCHDPAVVKTTFDLLRNGDKYWKSCGEYQIRSVRDLTTPGYDSTTEDKRPTLPVSSSTQMLTYTFENGCVLTLRTSGTEPKVKYYSEMPGKPGVAKEKIEADLKTMLAVVLPEMLGPIVGK